MKNSAPKSIVLYGSSISYFTGKMENYFRVKAIPYRFEPLVHPQIADKLVTAVGSSQMPAVCIDEGCWMTDSTPMIQWFEKTYTENSIVPVDPIQRFFSLVFEDYADEWLWRPAMHFRWHYHRGAQFAGTHLAHEIACGVPGPIAIKRWRITHRQRKGYTIGDGVLTSQIAKIEQIYFRTLAQLEAIFSQRPFLLGEQPSLADIAFSGPFTRHFGLDPVPAEIMRQQAPAVYEWVARLWNSQLSPNALMCEGIPLDWEPILCEIGMNYLPYLNANVEAVGRADLRFDAEVGGIYYKNARSSQYRVWCLHRLRQEFLALSVTDQDAAKALLLKTGCWDALWKHSDLPLPAGYANKLPFRSAGKMIDVY